METLSLRRIDFDRIIRSASHVIVARGQLYYHQQRATIEYLREDEASLRVRGTRLRPYVVDIWIETGRTGPAVYSECDCPYTDGDVEEICKHKIAAFLMLKEYYRTHTSADWSDILDKALAVTSGGTKQEPKSLLVFGLALWGSTYDITPYVIPADYFPVEIRGDVDAITEIISRERLSSKARAARTKSDTQRLINSTPGQVAAASMLAESWRYNGMEPRFDVVLPLLEESILYFGTIQDPLKQRLALSSAPARLDVEVHREDGGLKLLAMMSLGDRTVPIHSAKTQIISRKPLWLLSDSTLFSADAPPEMVDAFAEHKEITIPESDVDAFFDKFLPELAGRVGVSGDGIGEWRDLKTEFVARVYLKEADGELIAELRFAYDKYELPYDKKLPLQTVRRDAEESALVRIHRDPESEQDAWKGLSSYGLKRGAEPGIYVLRQKTSAFDFLLRQVPKLAEHGYEVYGEEELKSIRVNRNRPKLSLSVSSGIDWFDVQAVVNFGELEVSLVDIRRAFRKREKYVKLSDGSIGELPTDWLSQYRHLFDLGEESNEGIRLAKSQVMFLDQAIEEADSVSVDEEFERRRTRLKDFTQIVPRDLPAGFSGELRHYQKAGYDWLHFVHEYDFGGCLADDMGIGKTIQALVFLQSLRENDHAKTADLIVMPRSLLWNWAREAERFTPGLRLLVHADADRLKDTAEFDSYDLILTTYGVMLRDVEILRKYRFHYIVLDESQAVKNPLAHTSKAVRLLNGDHRLVLTGTPVENSTVELWSQFAFLNPGMLGSLDYFKKEFAGPIERQQDKETAQYLRALTYPFILRRTKEQVAPELPPRTERIVYCDMESNQRKVYDRWKNQYRALLLGMIEQDGMHNTRMKVLEGLLRLRQICNHPKLVDNSYKGESAKFEVLIETLETLRAEGHKALVFSQFTQMLKLLKTNLDMRKIPYLYLDGQTKDRQSRVDSFQTDQDIPFFLISLKAGGVGLNLTAADYVIHIDPWWNPAVERQASDRTHRIGQENPVFVHKLIARDSVEEKMLELQDRKRNLVDQLISTETSFFKSLTAEDVRDLFS